MGRGVPCRDTLVMLVNYEEEKHAEGNWTEETAAECLSSLTYTIHPLAFQEDSSQVPMASNVSCVKAVV